MSPLKAAAASSTAQNLLAPLWGGAIQFTSNNASAQSSGVSLHHFNQACNTCHDSSVSSVSLQGSGQQMAVDINRSCTTSGCHDYDRVLNHPVGVRPDGSAPSNMPLDQNSRMTCLTCHEAGSPSGDGGGGGDSSERTLSIQPDSQLCAQCHSAMGGDEKKRSHWQFSSKAHLGEINPQSTSAPTVQFVGNIDIESQTCVGCHEDVSVTVPGINETYQQKKARWRGMKDHAIGMEYASVVAREARRFRHPSTNSGKIRLFDGKVGCGSCHSLYAQGGSHLVVTDKDSELCSQCHIQ
jgi:hypothetical protein